MPPERAGEYAREVPVARPEQTAGDIRRALIGHRFGAIADVAVLDGDRLLGLVPLTDLLAAAEDATAGSLMDTSPPLVSEHTGQEEAAWRAIEHGEVSLAVVDGDGKFLGVIPPRRLLGVLLHEHEEDLARAAGVVRGTAAGRMATEERVTRRYRHRLPWLLVGLAGALLSAGVIGRFEQSLERNVILAFFVPAVVYMADAVGTQTETLVVRGLSLGVPVRRVVRGEALTGLLIGITLSIVSFAMVLMVWGDREVATVLGLTLFGACSTATVVAVMLPWAFSRFGFDPAFGSGPLATVLQDLVSIALYFAIAVAVLG